MTGATVARQDEELPVCKAMDLGLRRDLGVLGGLRSGVDVRRQRHDIFGDVDRSQWRGDIIFQEARVALSLLLQALTTVNGPCMNFGLRLCHLRLLGLWQLVGGPRELSHRQIR